MSIENFRMHVQCPLCEKNGFEKETLILHGDEDQNMQCLNCGYATNAKYKGSLDGHGFTDDFMNVCVGWKDRYWVPAVFTTDNYFVLPDVRDKELVWVIRTKLNTESTEVVMPHFSDAYNIVQTMEKHSGNEI
tara:strand:+ start:636 stop:1034 length:399 start_codon:yes stop_codon:yes gene_type:complete